MGRREELAYEAASMYYLQDETMDVIARRLGMSRSTVSRLIKQAREEGLVRISLHQPHASSDSVARALKRRFGVNVKVVPVRSGASDINRLEQVARVGARTLTDWVRPGTVIGLAWGTTTSALVEQLVPKPTPGCAIVQLNGAANPSTSGIPYAGSIIISAAAAFDARFHHFPMPAFFDYAQTREAMWRERSTRRVLEVQRRADIAVFGVGSIVGPLVSHVYAAGYLDEADMETLRRDRVVGDVCTVLLREDGTYTDIELNARATGPTPKELSHVEKRLCVVSGPAKASAVLGALRSGVITDLVIDEQTAEAVLNRLNNRANAK